MKAKVTISEKIKGFGVYFEKSFDNKFCFKNQFPGQDVVTISDQDESKAASRFFIEYLKSLHYSLRWLYENGRKDELKVLIDKQKSFADPNIDKTIEIITRDMVIL